MTNDYPSSLSSFAAASILDRAARAKAGKEVGPALTPSQQRRYIRAMRFAGLQDAAADGVLRTTFPNDLAGYDPAVAEAKRRERAKHTFWTLTPAERFARLAAAFQAFAGTRRGAVA